MDVSKRWEKPLWAEGELSKGLRYNRHVISISCLTNRPDESEVELKLQQIACPGEATNGERKLGQAVASRKTGSSFSLLASPRPRSRRNVASHRVYVRRRIARAEYSELDSPEAFSSPEPPFILPILRKFKNAPIPQVEEMRQRLEEKNRMIEKKTQAAMQAQQERNRMNTELTEIKDHMDIKDRKINVLQRKVKPFLSRLFLSRFIFPAMESQSSRSCFRPFLYRFSLLFIRFPQYDRTRPRYFYIHRESYRARLIAIRITLSKRASIMRENCRHKADNFREMNFLIARAEAFGLTSKERCKCKSGRVRQSVFSYHVKAN